MLSGGRFEVRGETLLQLISRAYGVTEDKVFGGPVWLDTDRFDVFAVAPAPALSANSRAMLKQLLTERFRLVAHVDNKPVPVYALLKGERLLLGDSDGSETGCKLSSSDSTKIYTCKHLTMEALVAALPAVAGTDLDRAIVDLTGLKGAYDFVLRWTPRELRQVRAPDADDANKNSLSFFTALNKQLGLQIEERRRLMPVVVVDSVDRVPAAAPTGNTQFPASFEVAEVRPSPPDATSKARITGDVFEYYAISLRRMLAIAYNVGEERVTGGPKWLDSDRFDTIAKAPRQVPAEILRAMFRSLILDQFKVSFHMEERPAPVFALTAVKHNLKLKDADPLSRGQCRLIASDRGRIYSCQNTTMSQLAQKIRLVQTNIINLPVVDLTGLPGAYDFTVRFDPAGRITNEASPEEASTASTPTGYFPFLPALERQTGLKLEKQNYPSSVMVIDHAERGLKQ